MFDLLKQSELFLMKQNIEASDGKSTPPEVKSLNLPLIEVGVLKIDKNPGRIKLDLMKKRFRPFIIFMSVQIESMSIFPI